MFDPVLSVLTWSRLCSLHRSDSASHNLFSPSARASGKRHYQNHRLHLQYLGIVGSQVVAATWVCKAKLEVSSQCGLQSQLARLCNKT